MQIITEIPDGKPGRPDNQRSRFLKCQPGRDLPKKTEIATGRKRNAILSFPWTERELYPHQPGIS